MKAAILTDFRKLEYKDVPIPEINGDECLIKVKYAGVCGTDVHIYEGNHPTAKTPIILGHEFVGVVEKINDRSGFDIKPGDRVVAEPLSSCGTCYACRAGNPHVCAQLKLFGFHLNGGFAEYIKVPLEKVIKIPDYLSDKAASLAEPFAVGYHVNKMACLRKGDQVLVIGGGPIGLTIGMVAQVKGASSVVFSEINDERIRQIHDFGFERVINPGEEDCMKAAMDITEDTGFDIVYEVSGTQSGLLLSSDVCKIKGKIVPVGIPSKLPEFDILKVIFKELVVIGSRVYSLEDFKKAVAFMEGIFTSQTFAIENLVSNIYQLEELDKAMKIMIEGTNLGKILIDCNGTGKK